MKTSAEGIALIQHFEDLRLEAYRCPAGRWTIGYGHTGPDVQPGIRITRERADELLRLDLEFVEHFLGSHVKADLAQHQFDALASFAFNVGVGAFLGSTLLRVLNDGDYDEAACQFERWVYSKGQRLRGLVRRRAAEKAMFLGASAEAAIAEGMRAA